MNKSQDSNIQNTRQPQIATTKNLEAPKKSSSKGTQMATIWLIEMSYCALCMGVVYWHNCGSILGACEYGWDYFVRYTHFVQYCGHWEPLYACIVIVSHPGNVAKGI